jgi:hypothetical protein
VLWCHHILVRQYRAVPPFHTLLRALQHSTADVSLVTSESVTSAADPLSIRLTPLQEVFDSAHFRLIVCVFVLSSASERQPFRLRSVEHFEGRPLAILVAP